MAKKTATGKAPAKPAAPPAAPAISQRRLDAAARRATPPGTPAPRPAAGPKKALGLRQPDSAPVPERRAPAPPKPSTKIKVQARRMGYYGHERRRVGDVFLVERAQFNPSWMVAVAPGAKLQRTTGREELRRKHDEILQMKHGDRSIPIETAEHDVEDTGDNPLDAD